VPNKESIQALSFPYNSLTSNLYITNLFHIAQSLTNLHLSKTKIQYNLRSYPKRLTLLQVNSTSAT
jgi:hypothetical protein